MYADPLELAKAELGDQFDPINCGPVTEADDNLVKGLHVESRDHGFLDERFWVETQEGIVIPSRIRDTSEKIKLIQLHNLSFAGVLKGFHKYSIGVKFGSWCMNFDESILAPTMSEISDEDELWVPTAAVKKIEPL